PHIAFVESICHQNEFPEYVTQYELKQGPSTVTFDIKHNEGDSPPHNEAVSVFQSKNHGLTLLSITSWYICCYPRADGKLYQIDIYQLNKINGSYQVSTLFLGKTGLETYGFEGNTFDEAGHSHYDYKNISSLTQALKAINY
ncbi:MAG: hypothetical protein Q4P13_06980, partial [Psychrobacter sp.]|nr:hypothetical protein [Psychrobacter sp.]